MLPIYISYFAGSSQDTKTSKTIINALAFVLGFTAVFISMGALAGTVGSFLIKYRSVLNIITGSVVVFFGLNYLNIFKINIFRGIKRKKNGFTPGFLSSALLGIVFSVGWSPCVGAFLGSALMMASYEGNVTTGILMLLVYSMGLGIPFVISALLIDKLKIAFNFIKSHYKVINTVCGIFLVIIGILMISGLFGRLLVYLR